MNTRIKMNNDWVFPCEAKNIDNGAIVKFLSASYALVLYSGHSMLERGCYIYGLDLEDFEPLQRNKRIEEWEEIDYPVWTRDLYGNVVKIISFQLNADDVNSDKYAKYSVEYSYLNSSSNETIIFNTMHDAYDWLNTLTILPKGTEIKITI